MGRRLKSIVNDSRYLLGKNEHKHRNTIDFMDTKLTPKFSFIFKSIESTSVINPLNGDLLCL